MNSEFTSEFFIESSKEWMKNKRKIRTGYCIYTCDYTFKHGKRCGRDCYKEHALCRQHYFRSLNNDPDKNN
jgi:hypothetical protein